jgi:hypothetical protein
MRISEIIIARRAVHTPFTTPFSICQPLLFGRNVCNIL